MASSVKRYPGDDKPVEIQESPAKIELENEKQFLFNRCPDTLGSPDIKKAQTDLDEGIIIDMPQKLYHFRKGDALGAEASPIF